MKFKTKSSEFSSRFALASRFISNRAANQALSGILVEARDGGIALSATDTSISIVTPLEGELLDEGGRVLVPGKLITDISRSLGAQEVEFTYREAERDVEITSGGSRFHLRTLAAEDFPQLPSREEPGVTLPAEALLSTIGVVTRAASRDDMRPVLTGVQVNASGNELTMVATDSYRLAVKRSALEASIDTAIEANIPAKALDELSNLLSAKGSNEATVSVAGSQAVLGVDEVTLFTSLIEGQFPNYQQLLPDSYDHDIRLPKGELLDVVKRVSPMAQKNTPLKLTLNPGEMTVSASTPEIGDASESIPASFEGEEMNIGFNATFFRDGIESVDADELLLRLISPLRPGLIQPVDSEDLRYLVMPIRLNP